MKYFYDIVSSSPTVRDISILVSFITKLDLDLSDVNFVSSDDGIISFRSNKHMMLYSLSDALNVELKRMDCSVLLFVRDDNLSFIEYIFLDGTTFSLGRLNEFEIEDEAVSFLSLDIINGNEEDIRNTFHENKDVIYNIIRGRLESEYL